MAACFLLDVQLKMWCHVLCLIPAFLSYATRMGWSIAKDFSDDVSHVIVAPHCSACALHLNSASSALPGPALSFRAKDVDLFPGRRCREPCAHALSFAA